MNVLGIPITTTDDLVKLAFMAFVIVCIFGLMSAIIGNIISWFKGDNGKTEDKTEGDAK